MKPNPNLYFLENLKHVTLNPVTLESCNPTMTMIIALISAQLII